MLSLTLNDHEDIVQLYQLRTALEGLAAKLAASAQPELSPLQLAIDGMREAAAAVHREDLLACGLQFHFRLCEAASSPFALEYAHRILLPFFAFVCIRAVASQQETSVWSEDLDARQRMVDLISEGECGIAQQSLERIAKTAHDNWEECGHPGR